MKPDTSHIHTIKVVSNTHWDREFRRSFERTRYRLLTMMDKAIEILEGDPDFRSFTLDGHSILVKDYLEMRPEMEARVRELIAGHRLIIGPYYTLAEEFSIGQEALVRNLLWGRRTVEALGGRATSVAYTPSSWGQTGQLPQILRDFGLDKMMFYRGISHHEADAEWIWRAPDGTEVYASRFGVFARYNWYYLVHRPVTTGRVLEKDYRWGEFDEAAFRIADGRVGENLSFEVLDPALTCRSEKLKAAVEDMVEREGRHFTTGVFLAMNGHDISAPHPLEPALIREAQDIFKGKYRIEQSDLEDFWDEALKEFRREDATVLTGERRAYLKEGFWTYLFPGTISARTYLKQMDFDATARLVYYAEPMACLGAALGGDVPLRYLERGWGFLLENHTHDANGGCAPDIVCQDMEYRYRKAIDIADIVTEEAMMHVAKNLDPDGLPDTAVQLIVYNPLPFERDAVAFLDIEIPEGKAKAVSLSHPADPAVPLQPIWHEKASSFVDSIWEVPRILETNRITCRARFTRLPALGYRVYQIAAAPHEVRNPATMITGHNLMENEHLKVRVNGNGTLTVTNKSTGRVFDQLNYLLDQGECGNAWKHVPPARDRVFNSLGASARVAITEQGPLLCTITASLLFDVPADQGNANSRSEEMIGLPVVINYSLHAGESQIRVSLSVDNRAKDHLLRVAFPTNLATEFSWTDSHFDVLQRPIAVPDSTGWVEPAFGAQPLRTFAEVTDGVDGLAVMPQGLFEYEVSDDPSRCLMLTLLRGCRIRLEISEEKKSTELPDPGIQCPGPRVFEYALSIHAGTWRENRLPARAAEIFVPVRMAVTGRGKGNLPHEASFLQIDDPILQLTAIKPSEDGRTCIVRICNPDEEPRTARLKFGRQIHSACRVQMDEKTELGSLVPEGHLVSIEVGPKKIITLRIDAGTKDPS